MDNPRVTTFSTVPGPSLVNLYGKLHGGELLKYLDQLASSTSRRYARGDTVTASVIGVEFLKPIRIGDLLILRGEIISTGRTSMVVEMVVTSEDFNTGETEVTNRAKFVMVHTVDGVPTPVTALY